MSTENNIGLSIIGASVNCRSEGEAPGREAQLSTGVNIRPADKNVNDKNTLSITKTDFQAASPDNETKPLADYDIDKSVPTLSLNPLKQPSPMTKDQQGFAFLTEMMATT